MGCQFCACAGQVWWFLKGNEAFPKETSKEGRSLQAKYKGFLEEASQGWSEPHVLVSRSKAMAVGGDSIATTEVLESEDQSRVSGLNGSRKRPRARA